MALSYPFNDTAAYTYWGMQLHSSAATQNRSAYQFSAMWVAETDWRMHSFQLGLGE